MTSSNVKSLELLWKLVSSGEVLDVRYNKATEVLKLSPTARSQLRWSRNAAIRRRCATKKLRSQRRYFPAFFPWRAVASCEGCFASARRSFFFRRLARFLALSLPLLCPISPDLRPLVARGQRERMGWATWPIKPRKAGGRALRGQARQILMRILAGARLSQ